MIILKLWTINFTENWPDSIFDPFVVYRLFSFDLEKLFENPQNKSISFI